MTALVWLLTAVVAVLALLVVGLLRSHATIIRALHDAGIDLDPDADGTGPVPVRLGDGPEGRTRPGVPEPAGASGRRAIDIAGVTAAGAARTVAVTSGPTTLLAFLTAGCSTCAGFWEAFAAGDGTGTVPGLPADVRLVIVTKGPDLESPADVAALAPPGVLTLQSSQAWDDYGIPVAPYFALVDGRRGVVVGEGAAASWARVRDLLDRARRDAGLTDDAIDRRELLRGGASRNRARVDRDLLDAGIRPGDPRLHHGGEQDA